MSYYGRQPRGVENNGGGGLSFHRLRGGGGFGEIQFQQYGGGHRGGDSRGGGDYYGDRGGGGGGDLPHKHPAGGYHRGGGGFGDGGRGGGRGYDRGGPGGRGRGGFGGGRGGGRDGRGGGRGGGRGQRGPDLTNLTKVKSNIILSSLTSSFSFYMYTTSCMKNKTTAMDSRWRRFHLFNKAIFDTLLKDMLKGEKKQLRDVTFFQGSYFFSARPIPGLEPDKLPLKEPLYTSDEGETFTVNQVFHFTKPKAITGYAPQLTDDEVAFDCRCTECPRKAFGSVEDLLTHCKLAKHTPMFANADGTPGQRIPDENTFLQYVNVVLQKALASTNTLAPWGKEFIDPREPQQPTFRGDTLGILVFRAFSCEFGFVRPAMKPRAQLGLTVDLRAKIMRNKSVLDELCDEFSRGRGGGGRVDPNTMHLSQDEQERANRYWIGQVVIYKLDKKTYDVKALRFDHSAESLPVEGLGMNHAEYFLQRKRHALSYPGARPMVEVRGRRDESIYFPAELVCGNELDPNVREQLPKVASYEPKERDKAVNEMMGFIGQRHHILSSCGIILNTDPKDNTKAKFLPAKAIVLKAPQLVARGIKLPERYKDNWTAGMQNAWFDTASPRSGVKMKVVLFHNDTLDDRAAMAVFNQIRTFVGTFKAPFDFEDRPYAVKSFRASDDARDQMDKMNQLFQHSVPSNIFVLNFIKPRGKVDPSYPIIKHLLGCNGYLSQFVSFKTFNHALRLNDRKSKMILQGVARQILQKSGVRLWWVSLPPELPLPAVFVGVDIFHAPRQYSREQGGRVRKPSCAAIVIQVLRHNSEETQQVEIYSETYTLPGGQEAGLMEPLRRTVQNAMKALDVNPMSCIVWRDGISESSFDSMAKQEIQGIQDGLKTAGDLTAAYVPVQGSYYGPSMVEAPPAASMPDYASGSTAVVKQEQKVQSGAVVVKKEVNDVPMSYIICQKRIATKFLTTGGELDGEYGAPPGTLVDGIHGLKKYETFYIQGRAPPGSTAKPVRYITIKKDDQVKDLNIPKLTWDMCHDYPNWTGPIKVPSVCMCAHKLAMLAGTMPRQGGDDIAHRRFKNTMHFL